MWRDASDFPQIREMEKILSRQQLHKDTGQETDALTSEQTLADGHGTEETGDLKIQVDDQVDDVANCTTSVENGLNSGLQGIRTEGDETVTGSVQLEDRPAGARE